LSKLLEKRLNKHFSRGLSANGHDWIDALQDRNLTAHTYNEAIAITVKGKIRGRYFQLLEEMYVYFKNKIATRGFLKLDQQYLILLVEM